MKGYRTEIKLFKEDMQEHDCVLVFEDDELIAYQKGNNITLFPKYKMLEKTPRIIVDERNCYTVKINQLTSIVKNINKNKGE